MLMSGFDQRISGVIRDCSANGATTTAPYCLVLCLCHHNLTIVESGTRAQVGWSTSWNASSVPYRPSEISLGTLSGGFSMELVPSCCNLNTVTQGRAVSLEDNLFKHVLGTNSTIPQTSK